jgi:DNA mismatch repair protein MutS
MGERADTAPPPLAAQTSPNRDTPAMRQHARFKAEHPGCILLFRMGDFYEMFDDDAVTAHRILGITLTERTSGIPMAGVPFHSAETYLRRLVESGQRVAVCEQVEDPKAAKGVVERAVVRVVTPGTRVDESLLEDGAPNRIAAVVADGTSAAVATVELSTGSFEVHPCARTQWRGVLARLAASEALFVEGERDADGTPLDASLRSMGVAPAPRAPGAMSERTARDAFRRHFGVSDLSGYGLGDAAADVRAAGALLAYLLDTHAGLAVDGAHGTSAGTRSLAHLEPPRRITGDDAVQIDEWTMRALEVERTQLAGRAEGSLMGSLLAPRTPMGRRLAREWLLHPLRDASRVTARHAAVGALHSDDALRAAVERSLAQVQDIARIHGRVAMRRATPRDIVSLGRSLARIAPLAAALADVEALAAVRARLDRAVPSLDPLSLRIAGMCVDDAPAHMREGGLMRDGVDADLDDARALQRDAGAWLADYQSQLVAQTGIESLRTGYNRVFGFYIEVTHTHTARVPATFVRRQTLRNAERYTTPELKSYEDRVLSAESRALERERTLFEELLGHVVAAGPSIADAARAVAELDCLWSFAEHAARRGWVRPTICEDPVLDIVAGRHPALDQSLGSSCVPNDCALGGAGQPALALVTGPNMAGKSTYIRQNALLCVLALAGSFVPAERATIGTCDRIYARIGAGDELHAGRSTFMVEMTETAQILNGVTARSVVVLDEIGRGTSTLDGLSLAWAIAETLAASGCRTLFATHYHEITALADHDERVGNLRVAVREWKDDIVFLHRIEQGRADRSYGIHVARLAGLPARTIRRARSVLESLAVHGTPAQPPRGQPGLFDAPAPEPVAEHDLQPGADPSAMAPGEALAAGAPGPTLSAVQRQALDELAHAQLDSMSPLQAFDLLRRVRGLLG